MVILTLLLTPGCRSGPERSTLEPERRSLEGWLHQLDASGPDSEPRRAAAVEELAAIGPEAAPALVERISRGPDPGRLGAISALGRIGPDAELALPALLALLREADDPDVRAGSATALGDICRDLTRCTPPLVAAMSDDQARVRSAATAALRAVGADAPEALAACESILSDDPDASVRREAILTIGELSGADTAIPLLVRALEDEQADVRAAAVTMLFRLDRDGTRALNALASWLSAPGPERRRAAIEALSQMDLAPDDEIRNELMAALKDPEPSVRAAAASALPRLAPRGRDTVATLIEMLADPDAQVREASILALPASGNKRAALQGLGAALDDADPGVVEAAVRALGDLGRDAVPALVAALRDEEFPARIQVIVVLGRIGPNASGALPVLRQIVATSDDPELRSAAEDAVRRIQVR